MSSPKQMTAPNSFSAAFSVGRRRLRKQPNQSTPTRGLTIMNLALRGIEADFGKEHADTFRTVRHPDLRADYLLANPPFNPARCGTNFDWVQRFIHHLALHSMVGFVLGNGSMSSNQSGEGDIRRALIEADLADCMVVRLSLN